MNTDKKVIHRLKISKGHLEKIISMVEKGDYCIDIIHQSQAVQSALRKVDRVILDNHLKTCVADAIGQGKKEEVISEVMKVVEKF